MKADFVIPVAPDLLVDDSTMSIDEATDLIFTARDWPLLGGPSGRGASYFGVAQRCARLFQVTYDSGGVNEGARQQLVGGAVPLPLQIGALFHTLMALYYGAALGPSSFVEANRGGLCALAFRRAGRAKLWPSQPHAVDEFLEALKEMCGAGEGALEANLKASVGQAPVPEAPGRAPSLAVVLEAERLFDAHTRHWGKVEDVTPVAVEWFAGDPNLGYTCRYDMLGRVGDKDPVIPPGLYIFERKTAKWIDEESLEGWSMDPEILGQLLLWKPSGCEERFGLLTGLVMDVVSKAKIPECRRVIFPPELPPVNVYAQWIEWAKAQIATWRALKVYPQSFANCWHRYGRCHEWKNCALGLEPAKGNEK